MVDQGPQPEVDTSTGHVIPVDLLPDDSGPTRTTPPTPEPSHAERARTITVDATRASLATLVAPGSDTEPLAGYPYCATANVVVDDDGAPLTFVSTLAPHTHALHADPRACVLLTEEADDGADQLAAGRVTLLGRMQRLDRDGAGFDDARRRFLTVHPHATYVDYHDFECWRLRVTGIRYVGGFGRMSWVDPDAYAAAAPDPLRHVAPGAVAHLNDDHADALLVCAQALGGVPDATAARVDRLDRYGMDLHVTTGGGSRTTRVAFVEDVADAAGLRAAAVAVTRLAREHSERVAQP